MTNIIPASKPSKHTPWIDKKTAEQMRKAAILDPETFWAQQAEMLEWKSPFHTVKNTSFEGDVCIKWFEGGKLNVSANCIDRHLATKGEQAAIIWEGDNPDSARTISYHDLHHAVCKFANLLKNQG